ncbi:MULTISPECIES: signal peptidase I [Clostridium]|uniref:Signal peptidase I n=1 Tax=Clostridium novyi (strain NT) TaxID=386415 RepID=A0Q2M8_CLONN|nr:MULTISPECIES: signal peptidase I [Clostridium]ABK62432.1 signal peptidase I [Clostridium novyi NT]KEH86428.1 signal peptidase [Clostridium novyi A str. NCTC 538]KEH89686.1 signal peptidase [Clostridium novyi A str. 4540]KEH90336.1 signal peptidase [Clostridium novyi A str. BKT29909]KEH93559.1 signal peptidase [Clostridium botulinum C/D str. It1]
MNIKKFFINYISPILIGVICYFVISRFLLFQVRVPSMSMYPTIKPGDRIMVSILHSQKSLHRGDIVVFNSKEENEYMIKRLIGLPGDDINITENGEVYINNEKIDEPYVVYNGGAFGKFKVPDNCYFFMGDNRNNSFDSRRWNNPYIQWEDIKGKAQIIIYPFNRLGKFKVGNTSN